MRFRLLLAALIAVTATAITTANAATNNVPALSGVHSSPADEMLDKLRLATGRSVSGTIIDSTEGEIILRESVAMGDQASTVEKNFNCSDIDDIVFVVPDIALEKKIVKEAMRVGNGILAYNIACSANDADLTMKSISGNHDLAEVVADLRAARAAFADLLRNPSRAQRPSGIPPGVLYIPPQPPEVERYKKALVAVVVLCHNIAEDPSSDNPTTGTIDLSVLGGFRGINWGADIKTVADAVKYKDYGYGLVGYTRAGEKMHLDDVVLAKIEYSFYKGRFISVVIVLETDNRQEAIRSLQKLFNARCGPVLRDPASKELRSIWKFGDVSVGLDDGHLNPGLIVPGLSHIWPMYITIWNEPMVQQMQKDRKDAIGKGTKDDF